MVKKHKNANPQIVKIKNDNIVSIALITFVLSIVIIAIGWYLGDFVVKSFNDKFFKNNIEEPKPLKSSLLHKNNIDLFSGEIISLPVILTNLKSNLSNCKEDGVWLRTEINLVLNKNKKIDDATKAKISDNFLSYFKETDEESIRGSNGLMQIKEDLLDRVNILTNNAVKNVFIKTLILQ